MAYKRKTRDEWRLLGNYGYGWDVILTEDTRAEALEQLKTYRENEPGIMHILERVRVKIDE